MNVNVDILSKQINLMHTTFDYNYREEEDIELIEGLSEMLCQIEVALAGGSKMVELRGYE